MDEGELKIEAGRNCNLQFRQPSILNFAIPYAGRPKLTCYELPPEGRTTNILNSPSSILDLTLLFLRVTKCVTEEAFETPSQTAGFLAAAHNQHRALGSIDDLASYVTHYVAAKIAAFR